MEDQMIILESPIYNEWTNGRPSDIKRTNTAIVNKSMIACIEPYIGSNLHEGWNCSKVTVNAGRDTKTFYDVRLPHLLHECIKI